MQTQHLTIEIESAKQGVAYTPGDGSVVWLNDQADSLTVSDMTLIQRRVAAARFLALAALMESGAES
jgi:hypothetical protein